MKRAAMFGLYVAASLSLSADREQEVIHPDVVQTHADVSRQTITRLGWLVAQGVCELDGYILDIPLSILRGKDTVAGIGSNTLRLMIADSQPRNTILFEFTDAQLGADQTTIIAGVAEYPKEVEALNVPTELAVGKNSVELIC